MRNRAILFAGAVLALINLAGCLIIPTDAYLSYSRENIAEEPPAAVVPEKMTREEVMLNLGEPDEASQDELELWYMASKMKAIIIVGDRGGEIDRDYIHVIRFDRKGVVESLRSDARNASFAECAEPHFSRTPFSLQAQ